jgi:solute carrier family 41
MNLGTIMIIVVIISHKCKLNPDNIATPIAASLGDLTTLAILAGIGGFLFHIIGIKISSCRFLSCFLFQ